MPDDTPEIKPPVADDRNALVIARQSGTLNVVPANMGEAIEFAKLMSRSAGCIPAAFREQPGACLALALQAWRWGADPFAVANKAYVVNDRVAYEAQLIHAIVNSSPLLAKRLRHSYEGTGQTRKCRIIGWVRGEDQPFDYESPTLANITVKNSPLWKGDPDQQLAYYATRAWARRHVPEIILGIYTSDEIEGEVIDVTPHAHHPVMEPEPEPVAVTWEIFDHVGERYEFAVPERAVEACRKILIAVANDPAALLTAWENNAGFLLALGEAGHQADADALERLHGELAPREPRPPVDAGARAGPAETAAAATSTEISPGRSSINDALDASAKPLIAGAGNSEQSNGVHEGAMPSAPAAATDTQPPEHASTAPAAEPAQATAEAMTGEKHDPFWDRQSLTLKPPPVRGSGSLALDKADWKVWPALILPRIRQAWSSTVLDALYRDNADLLDPYARVAGQREADEVIAAFEDARVRLSGVISDIT